MVMATEITPGKEAKEFSLTLTACQRANAVRNAGRYEWARAEREAAEKAAAPWRAMANEKLWEMVPSQELPRTIHVHNVAFTNKTALCPQCKEGIIPFGNYPWSIDVFARPWKIECPNCHDIFPKNDFGAYYRSALDEHGFFRRAKGDPKLLFNIEHPDPQDLLHDTYVDDGYGWNDAQGTRWDFVAVYAQWGLWQAIKTGISALACAYTLTNDSAYAHKCGVLLARLADVYPDMDWRPLYQLGFSHSDGNSGMGKVEGCIWEVGNSGDWSLVYDRIYDALARDRELAAFVDGMHRRQTLTPTPDPVAAHIEDNLVREIIRAVKDGRIQGNEGTHQWAIIAAAIALDRPDETPAIIEWAFAPGTRAADPKHPGRRIITGGNLANVITDRMDRDGLGDEGAPGYCMLWGSFIDPAADLLDRNPKYRARSIFREFPKFRQYYHACWRWNCLDAVTPLIGDSGWGTSAWDVISPRAPILLRAFGIYGDPAMARLAWQLLGRKLDGIHGSIYDEDPEALRQAVEKVVAGPELPLTSRFLDGFGLAILQAPQRENGRALWVYYGRNTRHGHLDRLNLGLYAENIDMLPDFGYPEYCSGRPKDKAWNCNNASHNVPTVDGAAQIQSHTGRLLDFEPEGAARLVDVASDGLYPGNSTCRRTAWLIDVGDRRSYVLDVVRVRGGSTHTLSWHGPPGQVAVSGITPAKQEKGTYAGPDVAFGALGEDWRKEAGYSFLDNVERAGNPPEQFTVDYRATDTRGRIAADREPHLCIHSLTPLQEVALADGEPPQNKPNAPRRMRFVLATRKGKDLDSSFVTLLEPYDHTPFVTKVRRLKILEAAPGTNPVAVEVITADGRTDTAISCEVPGRVKVEDNIVIEGTHGFLSRRGGRVERAKLMEGTLLSCGEFQLTAAQAAYSGTIARIIADDPNDQRLELSDPLPLPKHQAGRTLIVQNDGVHDAAYSLVAPPTGKHVSIGAITLVRRFTDPADHAKGCRYNVSPGDRYRVPTFAWVDAVAGAHSGNVAFKAVEGTRVIGQLAAKDR